MSRSFAPPPVPHPPRLPAPRAADRPRVLHWPAVAAAAAVALLFVAGITLLARDRIHPAAPAVEPPQPAAVAPVAAVPLLELEPVAAVPAPERPVPETPNLHEEGKFLPAWMNPAGVDGVALPPAVRAAEPSPPPGTFTRRTTASPEELCRQLRAVPEIDLDSARGTTARLLREGVPSGEGPHQFPTFLLARADLKGLPLRMGLECQIGKESAENLQVLSRKLRVYLSKSVPQDGLDTRPDAVALRPMLLAGPDAARGDWLQPEAVPTLTQLLQAEDKPLRLLLVELLGRIHGRAATEGLVRRALFDLSDEVREAAVTALRQRPAEESRPLLLDGFRYPWPPAADHAAEAVVALRDTDAVPDLIRLLDRPDPALPTAPAGPDGKVGTPVVHELVRVNHLRNCLLCHAPSFAVNDAVRGLVPTPGQPVPPSFQPQYYEANNGIFARADVTYLRQDFSVPQPVEAHGVWPASQRYDYLVRVRPANADELLALARRTDTYPQREAVLFALNRLTGKDRGALDWEGVLATAPAPVKMGREP